MNKTIIKLVILSFLIIPFTALKAQCEIQNSYFQGGEDLSYDLYFKYGIINKKAGNSSLRVVNDSYNGQDAYKMTLIAKSSGLVKAFFSISDTITSYMSKQLVPLAYMKDAHEDGDYTTERATYTYGPDGVKVRNINIRNGNLRYDTVHAAKNCMYDMLSIVYYVRALDYSTLKKGDKVSVSFFSGRRKMNMDIEHHGIENVSANNGQKYNCIKLSLVMNADAFADKDEAMKVFLTNDSNRIPVRIDSKLKLGSTRVILNGYKGQKN